MSANTSRAEQKPGQLLVFINGKLIAKWTGDASAIADLARHLEATAEDAGEDPEKVALGVISHVARHGLPQDEPERGGAIASIIYFVLHWPTTNADQPDLVRDHLPASIMKARLKLKHRAGNQIEVMMHLQARQLAELDAQAERSPAPAMGHG